MPPSLLRARNLFHAIHVVNINSISYSKYLLVFYVNNYFLCHHLPAKRTKTISIYIEYEK